MVNKYANYFYNYNKNIDDDFTEYFYTNKLINKYKNIFNTYENIYNLGKDSDKIWTSSPNKINMKLNDYQMRTIYEMLYREQTYRLNIKAKYNNKNSGNY